MKLNCKVIWMTSPYWSFSSTITFKKPVAIFDVQLQICNFYFPTWKPWAFLASEMIHWSGRDRTSGYWCQRKLFISRLFEAIKKPSKMCERGCYSPCIAHSCCTIEIVCTRNYSRRLSGRFWFFCWQKPCFGTLHPDWETITEKKLQILQPFLNLLTCHCLGVNLPEPNP